MNQWGPLLTVEDVAARLELELVYTIELSAQRVSSESMSTHSLSLETKYRQLENRLDYLFEIVCVAQSDLDAEVGRIGVSLVATYSFQGDTATIPSALIDEFGARVALFAAFPYIREAVQDLATRISLPGLTLPMLKMGQPTPFVQPN